MRAAGRNDFGLVRRDPGRARPCISALFTGYHLHVPPTKRYRSAWSGTAVHGAGSVVLALLILIFRG